MASDHGLCLKPEGNAVHVLKKKGSIPVMILCLVKNRFADILQVLNRKVIHFFIILGLTR
jgi:hypothetical protein